MNDRNQTKVLGLSKTRFILQYGVLGWGVSIAILFAICMAYSEGSIRFQKMVMIFLLFPLGGILWGVLMWEVFKRCVKNPSDGLK
jgi:hypothetical protein